MKRYLIRAYIIVVIFAFLLVSGSLVWRLYSLHQRNYEQAVQSFQVLSRRAAELWQTYPLEEAAAGVAELLTTAGPSRPVYVSVTAVDQIVDYFWASSERFLPHEPTAPPPRGFTSFVRSFALPEGDRRAVTAIYPLLPRVAAFGLFRDALVAAVILLALVVLVTLILYFGRREKPPVTNGPAARSGQPTQSVHPGSAEQPASPVPAVSPAPSQKPDSTLVPESLLVERLDSELERAGFAEQDLTVVVFEFNEGNRGDTADTQNCTAIRSFFTLRDLCFEHGPRGAAVLVPNASLAETIGLVERFQRFYWEQRLEWNRETADFHCGLASRAARLVDAARLLRECEAALRHSKETPGRIVGFQPDPQKYRDFLALRCKDSA